jgi:3-deoxy-manno-octulosonate cytidylyltransferase (CMP-KDO synthetase)
MTTISIIPARMASTRYPGKPMERICGIPMIGHVYRRVSMSKRLDGVFVATCDEVIADYIASIGGQAIMTSTTHERASERCAEAMVSAEALMGRECDIMVMVQGDEPLTRPEMIDEALEPLVQDARIQISNLVGRIKTAEEVNSPNEVKVVMDRNGDALYFSREPIPSSRKTKDVVPYFKQVPIIPFRRNFLLEYNRMPPTPLEIIESVDMLRLVENGIKIRMIETNYEVKAVDVPDDVPIVERAMSVDELYKRYSVKGNAIAGGA